MTAGHKWTHEESGALAYSQCAGNINVPELALSRLVEERNDLKAKLSQVEAAASAMREALDLGQKVDKFDSVHVGNWQDSSALLLIKSDSGQRLLDELAALRHRVKELESK